MQQKISDLKAKLTYGVTPAMATPLMADGYRVNTAVIPQLVDFLINKGVKGLFIAGTTGEGILLDPEEREKLLEATLSAVSSRVPVLCHVGTNRTDQTKRLAQHAESAGAAAIAIIPPTFYGMDDASLSAYFQELAAVIPNTPLLLYDIPHMAINGISPALFQELGDILPNLLGVKTSRPDAQMIRRLLDAAPVHCIVLAGNEAIALGSLALGAHGMISGLSTAVPEPFVALTNVVGTGDLVLARQIQTQINLLLSVMPAGRRIGGIKSILTDRGIAMGTAVPPRSMPDNAIWPRMEKLLT